MVFSIDAKDTARNERVLQKYEQYAMKWIVWWEACSAGGQKKVDCKERTNQTIE